MPLQQYQASQEIAPQAEANINYFYYIYGDLIAHTCAIFGFVKK